MKGKKKEEVDISTLPRANMLIASLFFDVKNLSTKFKLFEQVYKISDPLIHFITREHIIDFAKEAKIYVDPNDGKKPNPKDTNPPPEKKEITPEELAKGCLGLINERSIPCRKEKKDVLDKIEELKKQKEESEQYWSNLEVPDQKKKKVEKKKEPPKPEEIVIPPFDECETEIIIVLYNYPLSEEEYCTLDKLEGNDKLTINLMELLIDTEEYTEVKQEVQVDKKGKPIPAKEAKPSNEVIQMQKYFASPSIIESVSISAIFNQLKQLKLSSEKTSAMRLACFDQSDFTYKVTNETLKQDTITEFAESFVAKLYRINYQFNYFNKWLKDVDLIKLIDRSPVFDYSFNQCNLINSDVKYEHETIGRVLLAFCVDLIKKKRDIQENFLHYTTITFDECFNDLNKLYHYEYNGKPSPQQPINTIKSKDTVQSINQSQSQSQGASGNINPGDIDINHSKDKEQDASLRVTESRIEPASELPSHPLIEKTKGQSQIDFDMLKADTNSTPFKLIINDNDVIYKTAQEEKLNKKYVFIKEKEMNVFRTFPGIDVVTNQSFFTKGKKNEIYSFIPREISIGMYDKFHFIRKFETMLKQKVPEQKLDFGNRVYEESLSKDLFFQALTGINLFDYESYSEYDQRTDRTLLMFYYRCPNGRVYRRRKKYHYLSKPDFDNWIKYFSPTFKQIKLEHKKTEEKEKKNVKGAMSETARSGFRFELDPTKESQQASKPKLTMYEADDIKVGEVNERIKYMFPSDNSVIVKKVIESGIFNTSVSYIRKDDIVFGIKKNEDDVAEFWLNFNNGLKLTVAYKDDYNPFVKTNEEPVESPNGSIVTFTTESGLVVQVLPNGEICQKKYQPRKEFDKQDSNFALSDEVENYRIIASKATVHQFFSIETRIMYASGNVSSIVNNVVTNVNNKGLRIARSIEDNDISIREPYAFSYFKDPETNTTTTVREDNVLVLSNPDGSSYVVHKDDTKIYTSPVIKEITHYLIENDAYASTEITYDEVKKRTKTAIASGSTEALMGADDLMTRTYDGRLSKVTLPDKTVIFTYKEKKATEEFETYSVNTVTLVQRVDGTVIKIQQDGDIVVITSQERKKYNEKGSNLDFDNLKDRDYLFELNGKPEERKGGIYTADMKKEKIWTKDSETNTFELHANGVAKCKIQGTTIAEMNEKTIDEIEPNSPRYTTDDYINPETRFSDPPKNFYPPRMFIIDNSTMGATEYLCEEQVANYKLNKRKDELSQYSTQKVNDEASEHMWLTKVIDPKTLIQKTQVLDKLKLPQRYQPISQTPINPEYPPKELYIVRKIKETAPITDQMRAQIASAEDNLVKYYERVYAPFISLPVDKKIEMENMEIQRRIIRETQSRKVNGHA